MYRFTSALLKAPWASAMISQAQLRPKLALNISHVQLKSNAALKDLAILQNHLSADPLLHLYTKDPWQDYLKDLSLVSKENQKKQHLLGILKKLKTFKPRWFLFLCAFCFWFTQKQFQDQKPSVFDSQVGDAEPKYLLIYWFLQRLVKNASQDYFKKLYPLANRLFVCMTICYKLKDEFLRIKVSPKQGVDVFRGKKKIFHLNFSEIQSAILSMLTDKQKYEFAHYVNEAKIRSLSFQIIIGKFNAQFYFYEGEWIKYSTNIWEKLK